MKIKKKLQQIFKKNIQKIFIFFHGRIFYENNYNFLKENSLNKIKKININNLNYSCYIIGNGILYTDLVESVSVISNKNLVPGANFQKINNILVNDDKNISLVKGTPRIKKKINGTVASLIQDASGKNYAHWLLDILPKLEILRKAISIDSVDYFLLPDLKYNFQYETLKSLNIPLKKMLNSRLNRHLQAKKLIVMDHPWYHKGSVHDEMVNIHEWTVKWLRTKFLKIVEYKAENLKIFIDRTDSIFDHCQIINSKDLWNLLKKKGFKKYKLSEINFNDQVNLFNSANTIVGAHGAGFANTIFSRPNTKIIEIKPIYHKNEYINKISKINNLNHKVIISEKIEINGIEEPGDIFVDLNNLEKILDA